MAIKVDIVTAPAAWLDALVNGDRSDLDADECAALDKWLYWAEPARVVDVVRTGFGEPMSPRFTWRYRLHGGTACGGEVVDYVTHEIRE